MLDGTDQVWIDHVKISLIGWQMFVAGYEASKVRLGIHSQDNVNIDP